MSHVIGTVTLGSPTGLTTVVLGFQPIACRLTVSSKGGEVYAHMSIGAADAANTAVFNSIIQDTTGGKSTQGAATQGRVVSLYERVSGTLTEVLGVNFDSFVSNGVRLNIVVPHSGYQVMLEAWN